MKKVLVLILLIGLTGALHAAGGVQPSYVTMKQSGTIMVSGGGFYSTDLDADLRGSFLHLSTDFALFIFPMVAVGAELEYDRNFNEVEAGFPISEISEHKTTNLRWGPRAYLFLGGKTSELTPFIKGGPNFARYRFFIDDEEITEMKAELDLTASAGVLLNLAKNVGISAEAEYNFNEGEDINTDKLFVKFTIRSFLGE